MPSVENPWNQLLSKSRRRNKGDLSRLQGRLWYGLEVTEVGLRHAMEQAEAEEVRRWIHAMNQIAASYAKVALDAEIEQRLRALEDTMKKGGQA